MAGSKKTTNGRIPPRSSGATPVTPQQGENGYFLPEQSPKPVAIEGITVEGILQQMQLAYQTTQPVGTKDPVGVRRWRKLFLMKPDRFLAILTDQEKKLNERQEANRKQREEFTALGERKRELETENATLKSKITELEAKLPEVDEYDDPAVERLEELTRKLLAECERKSVEEEKLFVREGKCVMCGQRPIPGSGRAGKALDSILDRQARWQAHQSEQQEPDDVA
jgi:DNA repair exonuclease SbcCD ATPase subunit